MMMTSQRQQQQQRTLALTLILIALLLSPQPPSVCGFPQNDVDLENFDSNSLVGGAGGGKVDYNTVVGHFREFFLYLPVMMTTLKETMTGFPKFAEGFRVLTSKSGRANDECACKSNEIDR